MKCFLYQDLLLLQQYLSFAYGKKSSMSKQKWFICILSIRNRNVFFITVYILNFLYFAVSFLIKSHCLSITTSLLLIDMSQNEISTDTLSLILKNIEFILVLRTFLKGDGKIWLSNKVSPSCSHIHSLTVPGDKEQFLHPTKIISYSFSYQITWTSSNVSQP